MNRMAAHKNNLDNFPPELRAQLERDWQSYVEAAVEAKLAPLQHPDLLNILYRVWAASDFVAQSCIRHPDIFSDLLRTGDLRIDYAVDEYKSKLQFALAQVKDEAELNKVLREVRQREMLRIAWRDLAGWADVEETLAELSRLAAACVDAALQKLHRWQSLELGAPHNAQGEAQALIVIGMGKLGAGELNFSSDVDLIFAYPDDGETRGKRRRISNEEFFIRLAQRLIHVLDTITEQGFVFRVDTRLRPFGESGPLALSFAALEDYYQTHGREWERYALIKASIIAGDRAQGERLLTSLCPFVYRRYLDFNALAALRRMKELISQEMRRKGMVDNIKLGEGGIREVEFIGQVFQLIRGGRDTRLQETAILKVLDMLAKAEHLPDYVIQELKAAYVFLRRVENRLQEAADQQTHALPGDELDRLRLALAMNYPDWNSFAAVLNMHRKRVHSHFEQVFAAPQLEQTGTTLTTQDLAGVWRGSVDEAHAHSLLDELGFADTEEALRLLGQLRESYSYRALTEHGRELLDSLMPLLIAAAGQSANPQATLARSANLLEAIAQRTTYLALLIENPLALSQLVKLCAASPWISALLTHQPLLLDELLDARRLYAPLDKASLENELRENLARIPEHDLEQQMESLRHFKQVHVLRVAAADIAGALPLMVVSDHLTAIAEVVLQEVLHIAWRHLAAKHGKPRCLLNARTYQPCFAIVAYGKLGGIELGYGSDLDIVFLHDSAGEQQCTAGPKAIDNAVFFARLGQRIIHILSAHTPAGVLYEVDVRLRPSGASGLLVSSLESFADYQRTQAWTWEHQALVRARVIAETDREQGAGDTVATQFLSLRWEILSRTRDRAVLQAEVRAMRERMREALGKDSAGLFDLKQGRGGIADIEFMVQYSVLLWAHDHPALLEFPDTIRLLQKLADAGLTNARDSQCLSDAYRAYRAAVHRFALQEESAYANEEEFAEYRAVVKRIWKDLMEKQETQHDNG